MKTALAFLVLTLAWVSQTPAGEGATPEQAAEIFYRAYLSLNPRGLPTEQQMKILGPLLTPELRQAIAAARVEQRAFMRDHPDEKPPWIEDNLFASNYEGVTAFTLGKPTLHADTASIPVHLEYRDHENTVSRWIDVIVLRRSQEEWLVWDIFMNAPWPFRSGPNLRSVLESTKP